MNVVRGYVSSFPFPFPIAIGYKSRGSKWSQEGRKLKKKEKSKGVRKERRKYALDHISWS